MARIFLEYSHDSEWHQRRVRTLADHLRRSCGLEVVLDQYLDPDPPPEGWPHWMERESREADFVLIVCTEPYLARVEGRAAVGAGLGVRWEAKLIISDIHQAGGRNTRFIPVIFAEADRAFIPRPLRDTSIYCAEREGDFDQLVRRLTRQPRVTRPEPAEPLLMPPSAPPLPWPAFPLPPQEFAAVERAFGAASAALLGWPQESGGHWIERPELGRLLELITDARPRVTALLGGPGAGKSALLARLGGCLQAQGVLLLALKADQLPRTITTLEHLDSIIAAPVPVAHALKQLAGQRRTVLLIDQLDALADLMDLHSGRLAALLALIAAVRDTPGLQVVLSCREFEFRNDARLSSLQPEEVTLTPPPWPDVEALVAARGLDPSGWSAEVREVLRTPQHLALFLSHGRSGGTPLFSSYHGLLEEAVGSLEAPVLAAAEAIAAAMGEEEELSLGVARFSKTCRAELRRLFASGLLVRSSDGLSLSFRHQTVFDFLRARSFLADGVSLADHVLGRQDSLFVRPTLWSTLHYLRGADRAVYRREFLRLWSRQTLRLHLRLLLIDFLGRQDDPEDREAHWLLPLLEDDVHRPRLFGAMAGSRGWFSRLQHAHLPRWMVASAEEAWRTWWLLGKATAFDREAVLDLIERHWLDRPGYAELVYRVLDQLKDWNDRAVALAARLAGMGSLHAFDVQNLAEHVARFRPDLAPDLIARHLETQLEQALAAAQADVEPLAEGASEEERALWSCKKHRAKYGPIEVLITSCSWHDLENVYGKCPGPFIVMVWDWFRRVIDNLCFIDNGVRNNYRHGHRMLFADNEPPRFIYPLPEAFKGAIRAWAEADPDGFLAFVETAKATDLMVLHHLLALGLERIASRRPAAVLGYLLEDPRRLALGTDGDTITDTVRLIEAVAPSLSEGQLLQLERAILSWRRYQNTLGDADPKVRFRRTKWERERRLVLLRAIPGNRLSPAALRHRQQEERALPGTELGKSRIRGGWIGSPMSSDQMMKSTDSNILGLFEELIDTTDSGHPNNNRHWNEHLGGSNQASQEFANFAKANPHRALAIIARFQPGLQERPAGYALSQLGGIDSVPPADLIACIQDLDRRGFKSREFRDGAAWCLGKITDRNQGLDDCVCALLESWLVDWVPPTPASPVGPASREKAGSQDKGDENQRTKSLLWDIGGRHLIPGENLPILRALYYGYFLRRPEDADGALSVLEHHLDRQENPEVWAALTHDLRYLIRTNRQRAIRFLTSLTDRNPELIQCEAGVLLVAQIEDWMPPDWVDGILERWIAGNWPQGPQAAGEIAALQYSRRPGEEAAGRRLETFLTATGYPPPVADGLRLGLAYSLVRAWREADLRAQVMPLLLRLIPQADPATARALMDVFRLTDPLPPDSHTRALLRALTDHPEIPAADSISFMLQRLKDLLRDGFDPVLLHDLIAATIDRAATTGRAGEIIGYEGGDIAEIALTLHRLDATRSLGLDLFERLMALHVPGIERPLGALDRRPFA